MAHMCKKINRTALILGIFLGVLFTSLFVFIFHKNREIKTVIADEVKINLHAADDLSEVENNHSDEKVKLQSKVVSLPVSGVIEYSQQAVISAKQNGVVEKIFTTEGQKLTAGDLIFQQESTTLTAKRKVTAAENNLLFTQQQLREILSEVNDKKTKFTHQTDLQFSDLKKDHLKKEKYEHNKLLLATLKDAGLLVSETFKFIDDNKYLFSAKGLSRYDEIVSSWYGKAPDYLNQPPKTNRERKKTVLDIFKSLKNNDINADLLQSVTIMVGEYLSSLQMVMDTAEEDVFADDFTDLAKRSEYLQYKHRLVGQIKNLNTALLNWKKNLYGIYEQNFNLDTKTEVGDFNTEISGINFDYNKQLTQDYVSLNTAKLDLLSAEESLFTVKSPFVGQVSEIYVEEGEYVSAGQPVLKIVNDEGLEMVAQIPSRLLPEDRYILLGKNFLIDGRNVGKVDRLVTASGAGFVKLFISITDKDIQPGSELSGYINLEVNNNIFSLPKDFIYFKDTQPFIKYEDGELSPVEIVYDNGKTLWVRVKNVKDSGLMANRGLGFDFDD